MTPSGERVTWGDLDQPDRRNDMVRTLSSSLGTRYRLGKYEAKCSEYPVCLPTVGEGLDVSIDRLRPAGTVAGLADAVKALRAELNEAMAAAQGEQLRFEVGNVTMEFAVQVTTDATATAGERFWMVELGGSGSASRIASHAVTREMTPRTSSGSTP